MWCKYMSGNRKLIAFMGGMIGEEKNCYLIHALEEECRKNGYLMFVFGFSETSYNKQDRFNCEMELVNMAFHLDLKAIIIQLEFIKNEYIVDAIRNLAKEKRIPVIALERVTPGCINISMRYKNGFADMVRHVVKVHGCRKINMMAGIEGDHFSDERIEAYKEVLRENDIPIEEKRIGYGDFWDRPARVVTRRFLEEGDVPEAIVCANDNMAIAVCEELKELGYRVPEDIIVTGFDGEKKCLFNEPSMSTVAPDYKGEAAKIIENIKNNEGNPLANGSEEIDFLIKLRESCGCKRSEDELSIKDVTDLSDSYDDVNWAVANVNTLFTKAAVLENLSELSMVIPDTLWLWKRDFHFAAIFTDLLEPEKENMGKGKYTPFFRYRNGVATGIGEPFDENALVPNYESICDHGKISVLIVKLLRTGSHVFGYMVEGAENTNVRTVNRSEEFGMFLSTAINTVLVNRNLIQIHREIEKISVRDYLTGIYNRRGFFLGLEKIINKPHSKNKYLTVFSIDMDGLKKINDEYGHSNGDFALQCMAEAIYHVASRNGISARYGGDEFACAMVTDEPFSLPPDTFRERLESYLTKRRDVADKEYEISASVGSATVRIDDNLDVEKLIREADDAMYVDKKQRKQGW